MSRKTEAERIAALEARIAALKARVAAKSNPAFKHVQSALRAIEKGRDVAKDAATRAALESAHNTLSGILPEPGVLRASAPPPGARRPRADVGDLMDALLAHVKRNPGQRGEEIAAALGTDTKSMRPTMRKLIDAGKVRTEGRNRGMSYFAR